MKQIRLLSLLLAATILVQFSCGKLDPFDYFHNHDNPPKSFSSELATSWAKLQMQLSTVTPGFSPGVTGRAFSYTGIALYESIEQGMPGYKSLASQLQGGLVLPEASKYKKYYWPASANHAYAQLMRYLYVGTADANKLRIDSLENAFTASYQAEASATELKNAVDFGEQVSTAIVSWAKLDKANDVYPAYTPTPGEGFWVPTPPAFAPAAAPFSGDFRSFIPNLTEKTAMPPPIAYSADPGSDFYKMVDHIYQTSLHLSKMDTTTVLFWADLPGQFNGPSHFTSVLTQLIEKSKFNLIDAAVAYAKHGIGLNEAVIACFKTKYTYNLVRPITYIRGVMNHPTWNAVIATPPHPEYVSAHACVMQTAAEVLKDLFGKNTHIVDRTFDAKYGVREYNSPDDYAAEGTGSRILGGIHYAPSGEAGRAQGRIVGKLVNKLKFKN